VHEVAVHAFVLMDNHVHLLLSANRAGCVSLAMRAAGQAHVQVRKTIGGPAYTRTSVDRATRC